MLWRKAILLLVVPLLFLGTVHVAEASLPCALSLWPHLFYSGFEDGNTEGFVKYPPAAWGPGNNNTAFEVQDIGCDTWALAWIVTGFMWTDHLLQASVQFKEGTCNNLGLLYHLQNPDNFYLFVLSEGNSASLLRMQNGEIDRAQSVEYLYEPDRWYVLRVDVTGAVHRAMVNGVPVLEWEDSTFPQGTGGLAARGTRAWFDNVTSLIRPSLPLAHDHQPSVSVGQDH